MGMHEPALFDPAGHATTTREISSPDVEARLQCVIDLTVDFYWEQDSSLRFTVCRSRLPADPDPLLQQLLGKTNLDIFICAGGDSDPERHRAAMAAHESFRNVVHALRDPRAGPDRTTRYISFSGEPVFDSEGAFRGYRGVAQDVSTQINAQRLSELERAIVHALLAVDDLEEGLQTVLRTICESQRWNAGTFWNIDENTGLVRRCTSWAHTGNSEPTVLKADRTAPSWLGTDPLWVGDLAAHELAEQTDSSERIALATGVVVPIRSGQHLLGVLDFPVLRSVAPDPQLLRALATAAIEIARFVVRAGVVERLLESEQRCASTIELAAIGIAHVDHSGRFLYANPQLCMMLGYTESELTTMTVRQISHPGDANITDEMRDSLRAGSIDSFKKEKRYLRKDGSLLWVSLTIAARRDRHGHQLTDVSIVEDISARKSAEERVQYLATHDGLTGLPNRALFGELLNLAISTARRYKRQFAVLFIDLDRFKIINDSLGHEAGDVMLREIALRLRDCLRASDVVARLGGDEFVVLLSEVNDHAQAAAVARNILAATMRPVMILGQECRVTASIGICLHPVDGQDDQAVLKNADMAMYLAKEEGKNNFQIYSAAIHTHAAGRLALETNLRRALELEQFTLHYQAMVDFKTGAITGVEALLRWNNPELGAVSPTQFIPVAEDMGLIVPIGKWVLREACAQNVEWQRQGLPPVRLSVNLSMRQLDDPDLVAEIEAVLKETGLLPDLLELEVTESAIMHNAERTVRVLAAIKELGVRLAIDDFGTGYSSLAQLRRFPIDTLKVDRSFVREIPDNAGDRAIAEAIIAMGKTLSLTIVAEGVETPEQQAFLSEHHCDVMQGYYFSTPIAPDDFATLLRSYTPVPRS